MYGSVLYVSFYRSRFMCGVTRWQHIFLKSLLYVSLLSVVYMYGTLLYVSFYRSLRMCGAIRGDTIFFRVLFCFGTYFILPHMCNTCFTAPVNP